MRYKTVIVLSVIGVIVLALIIVHFHSGDKQKKTEKSLFFYCGAGIRSPVSEVVDIFSRKHNLKIDVNYGGSGTIMNQLEVTKTGDLFMPGAVHYIDNLTPQDLVISKHTVCYFIPVIMVRKGNPKNIKKLEDLTREGIRLGIGNPKSVAIGRQAVRVFRKNNIWKHVKKKVIFESATANELGVQIQVGKVDAVIIWDGTAASFTDYGDIIQIPQEKNIISTIAIAPLSCSQNKKLAKEFVNFITSERGERIFRKHHFSTELEE